MNQSVYIVKGFTERVPDRPYQRTASRHNPPMISELTMNLAGEYPVPDTAAIVYRDFVERTFHLAGLVTAEGRVKPRRFNRGPNHYWGQRNPKLSPDDEMIMLNDGRFFIETDILAGINDSIVEQMRAAAPWMYKTFAAVAGFDPRVAASTLSRG